VVLDRLCLCVPYLPNGSVPTLADLLEPPVNRPSVFYRGCDVYGGERGGFVSDVTEEQGRTFIHFDTQKKGNSNEDYLFGTDFSSGDKRALSDYLRTL